MAAVEAAMKIESLREKFTFCLLSHPHTPGHSLGEVGALAELLVRKVPKIVGCSHPQPESSGCRRFQTLFDDPTSTLFEAY